MSAEDNNGSIRYLFVLYSIPICSNVKNDMGKDKERRVKHQAW